MSLPPAYLSQKLVQLLPTKNGGVLRTIVDAVTYMLALPPDRGELCQRWRQATKLILDQTDVAAVSQSIRGQLAFWGGLHVDNHCVLDVDQTI